MAIRIETMSDCSEKIPYTIGEMKLYIQRGFLSDYAGMACSAHWHDDLEFHTIFSGRKRFLINGSPVTVGPGQGLFINSCQLHESCSPDGLDSEGLCVIIHPSLLSANERLFASSIRPVIENGAFSHIVLKKSVPWQDEMMNIMLAMQKAAEDPAGAQELRLLGQSLLMVSLLYQNMPAGSELMQVDQHQIRLKNMIGFVQKHYAEPVSVQDIAAAGGACKTVCYELFERFLRQTPMGYLKRYRLEKAEELLRDPNLTVAEISLSTGFSTPSYFTENFRRQFGVTPGGYRKHLRRHLDAADPDVPAPEKDPAEY